MSVVDPSVTPSLAGPVHVAAGATTRFGMLASVAGIVVAAGTAVTILAAVLLALLTPLYLHPALDAAGSAGYLSASGLSLSVSATHAISDRTVAELLVGPGSFSFSPLDAACPAATTLTCDAGLSAATFYDAAEASHLRDARLVLYGFLGVAGLGIAAIVLAYAAARRERWFWRAIGRGAATLAVALTLIGAFAAVAFEQAFTLFHEVFFPGGNWSFDPMREHLVQLYPVPFWELTAAVLIAAAVALGLVVWGSARRRVGALGKGGRGQP